MIGERVRLAREASRLTQIALAEAADVSQGTISDIESGRIASPADDVISNIADATSYPLPFFYRGPLPDLPDGHYRKLKRGTAQVSKQIRAQVRQIVELIQQAEGALRLPMIVLDPVGAVDELGEVEEIATEVRGAMGIEAQSPISNMTRAVERSGVVVVRLAGEMKDHDGFSAWPDYGVGGRPIIALSAGAPPDRARFNIGHELGHLVLHTRRPSTDPSRAEKEASLFAGAVLLPEAAARVAMRPPVTLRTLMNVKASYGISIAASARRALVLQIIDRDHFTSIQKQLSARRWRKREPVEVAEERARLIAKIIEMLASEGSSLDRARSLGLPAFAYRALTAV